MPGQPSATAISFGIAMTSGLTISGVPSGAISGRPLSVRRWFRINRHEFEAGDHTTGFGPFCVGLGQPSSSSVVAAPDDFGLTDTRMHRPSTCALSESLNRFARSGMSGYWFSCTAMSTRMQSSAFAAVGATTAASTVLAANVIVTGRIARIRFIR